MTCQHPNCSLSIYSICTNHCHWSLCSQHINEHRKCLINEFEHVLEDLIKPTNELSKSLEQIKQNLHDDQQEELDHLKQSHQHEIEQLEQQSIQISHLQKQYNQISEHLIEMKNNESLLTQNDFQHIDHLSQQIDHYKNYRTDVKITPKQVVLTHCPLTHLNIYGLSASHNVPLCKARRRTLYLHDHLRKYHHLTEHYANETVNAVTEHLDPHQTKIFPSNVKITDQFDKKPCPLHSTSIQSGILCTPCTNVVTDRFLPMHLKIVHRLRSTQIKEILNAHKYED